MELSKNVLRQLGYRLTPRRKKIIEVLAEAEGHISAEEVYQKILPQFPKINISTVYRTLELLKKLGLATETDMGDGISRYHFREKGHHHHLVCQNCGVVIELDEEILSPFENILEKRYDFKADMRHLAIFGLCSKCR